MDDRRVFSVSESIDETRSGRGPFLLNFSRATISKEIEAGVTPEILDACPIVDGRTRTNFSSTSRENPGTDL